jgi:SNF2 family DNA or RNA helicase
MILTDLDFTPALRNQVIARIHRYGQLRSCNVHSLVAAYSIEDFIQNTLLVQKSKKSLNLLNNSDNDNHIEEVASISLGVRDLLSLKMSLMEPI